MFIYRSSAAAYAVLVVGMTEVLIQSIVKNTF